MAATVELDDENTSSHTVIDGITKSDFGSTDTPNRRGTLTTMARFLRGK